MNEEKPEEADGLPATAKERMNDQRAAVLSIKAQLDAEYGQDGWRALSRHRSWNEVGQTWWP